MKVCIEIQVPSEGVLHYQDKRRYSEPVFHPLQHRLTTDRSQVVQQVPVVLENAPENIRHGEDKTGIGGIWELGPLLPLPLKRRSISAAGAGFHFAGEINAFYLSFRGIEQPSQCCRPTVNHFPETFADARPGTIVIPNRPGSLKNPLYRFF
jgi:hypothetical protein